MAVESRNAVTIQLKVTASRPKSFSMAGNAMFTEEIRKVDIKELKATIDSTVICVFVQFIRFACVNSYFLLRQIILKSSKTIAKK